MTEQRFWSAWNDSQRFISVIKFRFGFDRHFWNRFPVTHRFPGSRFQGFFRHNICCNYTRGNELLNLMTFSLLLQLLPHAGSRHHTVTLHESQCEAAVFPSLVVAAGVLRTPHSLGLGGLPFAIHVEKTTFDRRRRPLVAATVCSVILPYLLTFNQAELFTWNLR